MRIIFRHMWKAWVAGNISHIYACSRKNQFCMRNIFMLQLCSKSIHIFHYMRTKCLYAECELIYTLAVFALQPQKRLYQHIKSIGIILDMHDYHIWIWNNLLLLLSSSCFNGLSWEYLEIQYFMVMSELFLFTKIPSWTSIYVLCVFVFPLLYYKKRAMIARIITKSSIFVVVLVLVEEYSIFTIEFLWKATIV